MNMDTRADLPIIGFEEAAGFNSWLAAQPRTSKGLWLKLAKKGATVPSVSKAEAIDAALCHGWIDGQLDKYQLGLAGSARTPLSPPVMTQSNRLAHRRMSSALVSGSAEMNRTTAGSAARAGRRTSAAA